MTPFFQVKKWQAADFQKDLGKKMSSEQESIAVLLWEYL